ncbi:uncharacterized protein LOC9647317 [Selaginella moellendorffii]|nr:uncharacterized protein LOC9647317 [Selaginella moellendorffii]|eukprot:XP_024540865.1 uncharacterized protein LOC9647317 [Selaginella moellendorffii]
MSSCGRGAAIQTIIAYIIEHGSGAQPDEDMTALDTLTTLGYSYEQASQAIASCGAEDIDVLVDFLAARDFDAFEDDLEVAVPRRRKRARVEHHSRPLNGFGSPDETLERHSRRLKGFGLPAETPIPRR